MIPTFRMWPAATPSPSLKQIPLVPLKLNQEKGKVSPNRKENHEAASDLSALISDFIQMTKAQFAETPSSLDAYIQLEPLQKEWLALVSAAKNPVAHISPVNISRTHPSSHMSDERCPQPSSTRAFKRLSQLIDSQIA